MSVWIVTNITMIASKIRPDTRVLQTDEHGIYPLHAVGIMNILRRECELRRYSYMYQMPGDQSKAQTSLHVRIKSHVLGFMGYLILSQRSILPHLFDRGVRLNNAHARTRPRSGRKTQGCE
jgi:hypothetical protein